MFHFYGAKDFLGIGLQLIVWGQIMDFVGLGNVSYCQFVESDQIFVIVQPNLQWCVGKCSEVRIETIEIPIN